MRWVFIRPLNRSPYYDPEIQEPLGIEALSAVRRAKGDAVLILDSSLGSLDEIQLARRAAAFKPEAVGFSITTAQEIESVLTIHAEIVNALEQKPAAWLAGGNFVSTEPDLALARLPREFTLVRFEGELALDDFLARGRGDSGSQGEIEPESSYRLHDGKPVEDLDSLPFPDRPFAGQVLASGWAFNLQASRGCCGACRYCSSPGLFPAASRRWRGRSIPHIIEEMATLLHRYGCRSFNFVDEDFLGLPSQAPARAVGLAEAIRRRKLVISFGIQVRPVTMTDRAAKILAEAGLTYVFMGIESDDPEDFKRWGRPWTDDPWKAVETLRALGIGINAGVMLFHPHSTFEGVRRFARKLREFGLLDFRSAINRLDAMPGSEFHREGLRSGTVDPKASGPQHLPFIIPAMEAFHRNLILALEPLGPPSMHAICALPPLLARCRFDPTQAPRLDRLKGIIHGMDEAVAGAFFALLDIHEKNRDASVFVEELRARNLGLAVEGAKNLAGSGFAPSSEALRQAIRNDSGM